MLKGDKTAFALGARHCQDIFDFSWLNTSQHLPHLTLWCSRSLVKHNTNNLFTLRYIIQGLPVSVHRTQGEQYITLNIDWQERIFRCHLGKISRQNNWQLIYQEVMYGYISLNHTRTEHDDWKSLFYYYDIIRDCYLNVMTLFLFINLVDIIILKIENLGEPHSSYNNRIRGNAR